MFARQTESSLTLVSRVLTKNVKFGSNSLRADPLQGVPRFALLLQSEFPINAVMLASEALRIANQNSGRRLFEWLTVSVDGEDVRASNGLWLSVDLALADLPASDYYVIFEGNLPTQHNSPALLSSLREAHRRGATVIGVDTGAFALAQAGLIDGSVVVHWEAAPAFQERFPQLSTCNQLFRDEGTVMTCAGGVATLDMMLELIRRHHGETMALEVANALAHEPREGNHAQRADSASLEDNRSLSHRVLALMERHLDFPLPAVELASKLNVSMSTLVRHCKRHFGYPPMQLYLGVRLQAARNLLFYEDCSIRDVALAYGFSSQAVFARTFKIYFGQTPSQFRQTFRDEQTRPRLPEVRRLHASRVVTTAS